MSSELEWALDVAGRICWDRAQQPYVPGLHRLDGSGHAMVDSSRVAAIEIAAACRVLSDAVLAR